MPEYEYKPGLTFRSHTSAHQEIIRGRKDIFSADGTKIDSIPELVAEFAIHGDEYDIPVDPRDPDGPKETHSDIRGHFFNLDSQAEMKNWTDEERALVGKVMLSREASSPNYWLHSRAPTAKPWTKYDTSSEVDIPLLAEQFGCIDQAIAYESENLKRKDVLDGLRETLNAEAQVEELTAA